MLHKPENPAAVVAGWWSFLTVDWHTGNGKQKSPFSHSLCALKNLSLVRLALSHFFLMVRIIVFMLDFSADEESKPA